MKNLRLDLQRHPAAEEHEHTAKSQADQDCRPQTDCGILW